MLTLCHICCRFLKLVLYLKSPCTLVIHSSPLPESATLRQGLYMIHVTPNLSEIFLLLSTELWQYLLVETGLIGFGKLRTTQGSWNIYSEVSLFKFGFQKKVYG